MNHLRLNDQHCYQHENKKRFDDEISILDISTNTQSDIYDGATDLALADVKYTILSSCVNIKKTHYYHYFMNCKTL